MTQLVKFAMIIWTIYLPNRLIRIRIRMSQVGYGIHWNEVSN